MMRWAACLAAGIVCAAATFGTELRADFGGFERPDIRSTASGSFVLRAAGMPRSFTIQLMAADAEHKAIDTDAEVASLTEADVWVIGLEDWAATDWLRSSPLHTLFAEQLHRTAPDRPYRMFSWRLRNGRQVDLYFVHLGHAGGAAEACVASTIYAMSRAGIAARRSAGADPWANLRVQPVTRVRSAKGAFCGTAAAGTD